MQYATIESTGETVHISYFIANPHDRLKQLTCPSCDEPVSISSYLNDPYHFFKHKKKTEFTPECEKRISNISSSYQAKALDRKKTTTPIYLDIDNQRFNLKAKFKPLPLFYSDNGKEIIKIGPSDKQCIHKIQKFINQSYEILLNFIPFREFTRIELSPNIPCIEKIKNIWGNKLDYFTEFGAIFHYTSHKIIKYGRYIYCDEDYYLATIESENSIPVDSKLLGQISNSNFNVYLITVPSEINSEIQLFFNKFGVSITYSNKIPILVWPPTISNNETQYKLIQKCPMIIDGSRINSSDVWMDDREATITKDGSLILCNSTNDQTINIDSVDYVYTLSFQPLKEYIDYDLRPLTCKIYDTDGQEITETSKSTSFETNFQGYAIILNSHNKKIINDLQQGKNDFCDMKSITLFSKYHLFVEYLSRYEDLDTSNTVFFSYPKIMHGELVPVPKWARVAIQKLSRVNKPCAHIALSMCSTGKITTTLQKELFKWR